MADAPEDTPAYDGDTLMEEATAPPPEPKDPPEHDAWLWARHDG